MMHELNICYELMRLVKKSFNTAQLQNNNLCKVNAVWIEVGMLAGIELSALQFSFPIAAKNTIAEHADLKIQIIAGQAWCKICKDHVSMQTLYDACANCGKYDYQVTQGRELRLSKIEVN